MDEKMRFAAVLDALEQPQAAKSNSSFSAEKCPHRTLRGKGHEPKFRRALSAALHEFSVKKVQATVQRAILESDDDSIATEILQFGLN